MGNRFSNGSNDEDADESEEKLPDKEESPGSDVEGNLDLAKLFNSQQLREISSKLKEEVGPSLIQQHHSSLLKWIDDRKSRGDENVTLAQFTDFLTNRDVDKQVATEIFCQFDIEGNGVIEVEQFHEVLSRGYGSNGLNFGSNLQFVNGLLQDYPFTPGFLDAFTDGKTVVSKHGKKLAKFLARNRAPTSALSLPALESFINTTEVRLKVLQAHISLMKEKDDMKRKEPSLKDDEVLKPITKCFTAVEVSTNRSDACNLTDNDAKTFWQSDGPARSHWIRLKIAPNVVIRQLSINVASSDESYMPHQVVVTAGRDPNHLTELNSVKIPSLYNGNYVLVENTKIPYPVVQINIKRCHSDGCDTRVRQIKAVGYRVVKSKGVTVVDATAMWYLSVLASTAQAALPIAPNLRDSIIDHTRMALSHMQPLSLSSMASDKPGFLSNNVMEQMEKFLHTIVSMSDEQAPDDLCMLLEFALARGSIASIINVLKMLFDRLEDSYKAEHLLKTLASVKDKAVGRHGNVLQTTMCSTEEGTKQEAPGQENSSTEPSNADAYVSNTGKTIVNLVYSSMSGNLLSLTKAFVKVIKGATGTAEGFIFLLDSIEMEKKTDVDHEGKEERKLDSLKSYDDWSILQYRELITKIKEGYQPKDEDPMAYFSFDEDWCDRDVSIDRMKNGRYVVIKFLYTKQVPEIKRGGIDSVELFGYEMDVQTLENKKLMDKYTLQPESISDAVPGISLFLNVINFLEVMARDTLRLKSKSERDEFSADQDKSLDLHDISMAQIWDLYKRLSSRGFEDEVISLASCMVLNLFHLVLPYLKPTYQKSREAKRLCSSTSPNRDSEGDVLQLSAEIFQYLCDLVDNAQCPLSIQKISKKIIIDGAEVFFPDGKARRERLLSLVDQVMEDKNATSIGYTFESLCRFFSNRDASGLLGLPDTLPQENFKKESVVHVMQILASVAYRECVAQITKRETTERPSNLVQLLSTMQKSLLVWCFAHMSSPSEHSKSTVDYIITEYVSMISNKCAMILKMLREVEDPVSMVNKMEFTFISVTMRQLILFLNLFSTMNLPCIELLKTLQSLSSELNELSHDLPELFNQSDAEETKKAQENVVLRTWDVESKHNYDNNMHTVMVFSYPGSSEFKVEFDPKCETEKRYDYLEFTDSMGHKRRFDQRVGTSEWPETVEFKAGQKLHFLFHSDGSNNEWGYRFKVYAIGRPDIAISWVYDLQLNISRLFGMLCSDTLDCKKALEIQSVKAEGELALLHSELWSTLLRGGYRVGKLLRSFSGYHGSSPADSGVNSFLVKVVENTEESAKNFITKCKAARTGHYLGGDVVDSATNAVFAALIWHTQELREEIMPFVTGSPPSEIPSNLLAAFGVAEGVRRLLLEKRQKLLVLAEEVKSGDEGKENEVKDPDGPILSCKEKSLFLLKFAGLSKLTKKSKEGESSLSRKSSIHRTKSWNKQDSVDYKSSIQSMEEMTLYEKYPTFQMVTEFVTNEALSPTRIQALLKQRHQYADNVASIYSFATKFLQQSAGPNMFKPHVVMFLQQLLYCQQNFPKHYCDFLNGCGLEYENKVREQIYSFLRCLSNAARVQLDKSAADSSLFECAIAYILHFLTIDWKPYDHSFILEIELPTLLISSSQATAVYPRKDLGCFEMEMFERHMQFLKDIKGTDINSWCQEHRNNACSDTQRDINLFIARFSEQLDVQISCDGCEASLQGRRYRCLNCADMDLCNRCYESGERPSGHTDEHEIVDLRFKCNHCDAFIVGTRIHCNECQNFDLCYGCWKNQECPESHCVSHSTTQFNMNLDSIYTCPRDAGTLQTYVHDYSWLQFASLALSLSEALQERRSSGLDVEYSRAAADLLLNCLDTLVDILETAAKSPPVKATKEGLEEMNAGKSEPGGTDSGKEEAKTKEQLTEDNPENVDTVKTDQSLPPLEATESSVMISEGAPSSGTSMQDATDYEVSVPVQANEEPNLEQPSVAAADEDNVEKSDQKDDSKPDSDADIFPIIAQERCLGLIGALLPPNRQLTSYPNSCKFVDFTSHKLIPTLLHLLRSDHAELKIRVIALGVLSKALRCCPRKAADAGIKVVEQKDQGDSDSAEGSEGVQTVELLFKLGAECLERGDLDTASALETVLRQLTCTGKWHSSVTHYANACLKSLSEDSRNPTLQSLFALMVFAGFPDVYRIGTLAKVSEAGGNVKDIVILDYHQDRGIVSAYNFKSRKIQSVKEHLIDDVDGWSEGTDANRIPVLLAIIKDVLASKKGLHGSVEQKWVRALVLKALLGNLKAGLSTSDILSIMKADVIPLIVNLACQATRFSKQWLSRDLEILSWKLYKQDQTQTAEQPAPDQSHRDPLEGISKETKETFENIHDALNCSYAILRAMFENCGRDNNKLREDVQRSLTDGDGVAIRTSDEIKEMAKKWEPPDSLEAKASTTDSLVDKGVLSLSPQLSKNENLHAKPECFDTAHKLITSLTEAEKNETRAMQRRSHSAELLRKELDANQGPGTKDVIKKVNHAVAVGYARQLVAWLLALWPKEHRISRAYLNNMDASKVVGLLDLIQEAESKEHFEKVVFNFVRLCEKDLVKPLAISAVHCMGEVHLASIVVESEHRYKNNAKIEDKVTIPGATSLFIHFDDRCATEQSCDELILSSSSNYIHNKKTYSGTGNWKEFELPGDTLYYKFTSDSSENDWGYKFTVTGGHLGRFETGCGILNGLLAQNIDFARSLPLKQLWSWLIVVACNQIGQQRLMATGMLLRILQIAAGDPLLFGEHLEPLKHEEMPDLSLLRPLWKLYTETLASETGTSVALMSPVLRGLSELFLVVENVAQDLGMAEDLVARLAQEDKLKKRLTQAVTNIAAIGLAIDVPNKALDLLKNAPKCPSDCKEAEKSDSTISSTRKLSIIITGNNSDWSDTDSEDEEDNSISSSDSSTANDNFSWL